MLVLSRSTSQGVRLYDVDGRYIAHVVVLGTVAGRVKLGIDADSRFLVLRDEVIDNRTPEAI